MLLSVLCYRRPRWQQAAPDVGADSRGAKRGTMAQDPLSEVVRALDLKGGLFLEARMTAPWAFTRAGGA